MSHLSKNKQNNLRIANKRKKRHQERCEKFRDDQLYYEASVLINTLEGQIIKDISEIQPSDQSNKDGFISSLLNYFRIQS